MLLAAHCGLWMLRNFCKRPHFVQVEYNCCSWRVKVSIIISHFVNMYTEQNLSQLGKPLIRCLYVLAALSTEHHESCVLFWHSYPDFTPTCFSCAAKWEQFCICEIKSLVFGLLNTVQSWTSPHLCIIKWSIKVLWKKMSLHSIWLSSRILLQFYPNYISLYFLHFAVFHWFLTSHFMHSLHFDTWDTLLTIISISNTTDL